MRQTILWTSRMVLVAAISLFAFGLNRAAARGGGGGGHGGGGHVGGGGIHVGNGTAFHGGFNHAPAFHGGNFHAPIHNGNFFRGSAFNGRGFSPYNRGFSRSGYGWGWGYPYYGDGYGYSDSYSYPYYGSYSDADFGDVPPTYYQPQLQVFPTSGATPLDTTAPSNATASIIVHVPDSNAELTVDGKKTAGTGTTRYFRSPPLEPGNYSYQVQATWTENGKKVTEAQTVHVGPGTESIANFLSHQP